MVLNHFRQLEHRSHEVVLVKRTHRHHMRSRGWAVPASADR
jgi:ADP-ribose pyrophosphatase YjhB (NUDIX family)